MNRLNTTGMAVFFYCRFSIFLKDPFFSDYCDCKCSVVLPFGDVGCSAVCDCGISWSYSLTYWNKQLL